MRMAVVSAKPYDRRSLEAANAAQGQERVFVESRLGPDTAMLASGFSAVCVFVNDVVDATTLDALAGGGTRLVARRCTGYNTVDLAAAGRLGIAVVRVPAYSPHAVAEFTVGLILTLNRQIHRAYNRVRENNFALDGLLGFDLFGKTVGVIGTGKIGGLVARTLRLGFGCEVLAHDLHPDPDLIGIGVLDQDRELIPTARQRHGVRAWRGPGEQDRTSGHGVGRNEDCGAIRRHRSAIDLPPISAMLTV